MRKSVFVPAALFAIMLLAAVFSAMPAQPVRAQTNVATITVGSTPGGVALSPDGNYAYVANGFSASVSVISTTTNTVTANIAVGAYPVSVAVAPNGEYVYVTNATSVSVIDRATNTVTATITGLDAGSVAVTPNGKYIYVAGHGGIWGQFVGYVSVIDPATNAVKATITGFLGSDDIVLSSDGEYAYVANYQGGYVSVISTVTNAVTANITVGRGPISVAVTPNGEDVYVANLEGDTISVISTATNTVVTTITGGRSPYGVAVSPDGKYVYVANYGTNSVSVISTATNTVTAYIAVGTNPRCVAVSPNGEYAYVTNEGSNSVSVISTGATPFTPTSTPTPTPSPSPTLISTSTPVISILSPTNGAVFDESIAGFTYQIIYQTNSTLSWVGYSLDGGSNVTVSGNNTIVGSTSFQERIEKSGYNTLTLYANDTEGNWATPQTVTYLVRFYPDVTGASPLPLTTPSPSIPEFPAWTALSIVLVATLIAATVTQRRKQKKQSVS